MAIQETAVIEHVQDILTTLIIERVVLQETKGHTTVDFQSRCLQGSGEYPPATDLIRARYPNAQFYRDASESHYDSRSESSEYHFNIYPQFDRRLREFRYARSIYSAVLEDGNRQWLKVTSNIRFDDCDAVAMEPTKLLDGNSYMNLTVWITTNTPLLESKVTRGLPDLIQCRRRSCKD